MLLKTFKLNTFFYMLLLLTAAGCSGSVTVQKVSENDHGVYTDAVFVSDLFTAGTRNLLGNYLLFDKLSGNPEELLAEMTKLYRIDGRKEFIHAIAEVSQFFAKKYSNNPDRAAAFHLTTLLYCNTGLLNSVTGKAHLLNPELQMTARNYNYALTKLFVYLSNKKILRKSGFALTAACGEKIMFSAPYFQLPLAENMIKNIILCADFRIRGLTHNSRQAGIGVPLICETDPASEIPAIPATLLIHFSEQDNSGCRASLAFLNSRQYDAISVRERVIPLEQDFSTPLAYMAFRTKKRNFILRTFFPENEPAGLYLLEPRNDKRIPVLFVHGLMSDLRTWLQMINTLQSDPVLRKHYRFMGFTYSSGNPIFFSAKLLRESLEKEREVFIKSGMSTEKFDRMVVIGHSMGGLLSRVLTSTPAGDEAEKLFGRKELKKLSVSFTTDEMQQNKNILQYKQFASVKRVVFIAVPHRGSDMADSWFGLTGASLIRLPVRFIKRNAKIIQALINNGKIKEAEQFSKFNGIGNLAPESLAIKMINRIPMGDLPYHSIIGNNEKAGIPGGTDGVVPYSSSHLDNCVSELVVRSGHSVQQNPLAVQEIRRILLEHLKAYPENTNNSGNVMTLPSTFKD